MRLHRALFYILLTIFVAGILLAIFVDPTKVMSRVATGLVTGSFVGLLSTIVNYAYAWQSYFSKLFSSAFDLFFELETEYIEARLCVEDIEGSQKEDLINNARHFTSKDKDLHEKDLHKYDKYRLLFDDAPYASLFFSKKTNVVLYDLYKFVNIELRSLYRYKILKGAFAGLQKGYLSEEEEEILIGDKDDFFEHIVQSHYDWRDHSAHCMRKLGAIMVKIQRSLRPFNIGEEYRGIPEAICDMAESTLEGIPDRDIIKERMNELEENNLKEDK